MKSIKDYKEAMDNIRISEDFYAGTQALLDGLPEERPNGRPIGLPDNGEAETRIYEKKPVFTGKKITAVLMAAAACMMFVFGVRLALENGRQDISAPMTVTETVVSDRDAAEVEHDPAVLIDDIDENAMDDIPVDITPEEAEKNNGENGVTSVTAVKNERDGKTAEKVTGTEKETSVTTVTSADRTQPQSSKNENTGKDAGNASAEAVPAEGVPENNNDSGAETPAYDDGEAEEDIIDDDEDIDCDDEAEDAADDGDSEDDFEPDAAAAAPQEPLFLPPDPESVTVTVISGTQSTAAKNSADCKTLIDLIAKLSDSTETRAGSFTPLFTVKITDNSRRTIYTVYLTDKDSLVIDDGTRSAAVALSVENSEALKQTLQNMF